MPIPIWLCVTIYFICGLGIAALLGHFLRKESKRYPALSECDVQALQRPRSKEILHYAMTGAVGLSVDYSKSREERR